VSGSASPRVVDVPPTSSDVCHPAAEPSATVIMDDDDDDDCQLIGDFSRPCSLPVLHGKHADLHSISPDTVTYHSAFVRFITSAKEQFSANASKRICMKFSTKVGNGLVNKWLNFGADLEPIRQMAGLISRHWKDVPWRRYALSQYF